MNYKLKNLIKTGRDLFTGLLGLCLVYNAFPKQADAQEITFDDSVLTKDDYLSLLTEEQDDKSVWNSLNKGL